MCSKQVRGDPYWALAHQTTQNGTLTKSGLLKSGNLVKCREQVRGRPVYEKFVIDDDMNSDTATETNLSLRSRSSLHRVNDRVRKILDQSSKDAMQDSNKHFLIWRMFMSSTLEASVFRGKNCSENLQFIKKTGNNLTMKQMFDISEKLIVGQSDEIYGVLQLSGKILHGSNHFWSVMKKSSVSRMRRFTYFQILCDALER